MGCIASHSQNHMIFRGIETDDNEPSIADLLRLLSQILDDNEFFNNGEKRDLIHIGKKLAEYVHDQGIKRVAFIDTSARPAYVCLQESWRRIYPGEKMPEVYFLNPKAHIDEEAITGYQEIEGRPMPKLLVLSVKDVPADLRGEDEERTFMQERIPYLLSVLNRQRQDIVHTFQKTYAKLAQDCDSPLLVFDTCMHSGTAAKPILETLKAAGLRDIRVGLASNERNFSGITPDFVALPRKAEGLCYPFDKDSMIEKTYEQMTSKRNVDMDAKQRARRLREVIRTIYNLEWDNC